MALYALQHINLNDKRKEILNKVISGDRVKLSFSFPQKSYMLFLNGMIANLLGHTDLIFLHESFFTILRESLLNAVKANAKRLYFEKHNADIHNSADYDRIMKKFRNEVIGDMAVVEETLNRSRLYVNFIVELTKTHILLRIENNSKILPAEEERVQKRITQAWSFKDFSEAYDTMYDETEGAGLGIILTVMLLKNIGVTPDDYRIFAEKDMTIVSLRIPLLIKKQETITAVKEKILREINLLPTFPQNIMDLQQLCDNPDSSINLIADKIQTDPSLTADILKLANSAGFLTVRKIENVSEALMRIGLTNLKYILIAASSRKIMDKRYKQFSKIWAHCLDVAAYGRFIVNKLSMRRLHDKVFIASLLHDLGKIVLLSVDLDLTNWIADFVQQRGIRSTTILEEVSIGISHSTIGKLIAKKWNFADFMEEAIAFHHAPLQASEENRTVIYITYLANIFVGISTKKYTLDHIDPGVLAHLSIKSIKDCEDLYNYCTISLKESRDL
ncbi:MAG: HDOD domain-containing protein [Spirochaetes bacterium]|nr:HDOD domain-containing protein [Spirochaetota bacterium]MBN2770944.1 HDOD domain-containing protein [Spirochaetota bacterium]